MFRQMIDEAGMVLDNTSTSTARVSADKPGKRPHVVILGAGFGGLNAALGLRNAPVDEIRRMAVDQGMVPMREQALRLVADDVTTIAEVMRTIYIL